MSRVCCFPKLPLLCGYGRGWPVSPPSEEWFCRLLTCPCFWLQRRSSSSRLRKTTRAPWKLPPCSSSTCCSCRRKAGSGPFWMPCTMQVGSFFSLRNQSYFTLLSSNAVREKGLILSSLCLIVQGQVKTIFRQMIELSTRNIQRNLQDCFNCGRGDRVTRIPMSFKRRTSKSVL